MNLETPKLARGISVWTWPPLWDFVVIGWRRPEHWSSKVMSIFVFVLFCFFSCFFDRATGRTAEPILIVDSSNDVFLLREVPFGIYVTIWPQLWAWLPKNTLFGHFWANAIRGGECTKTGVNTKPLNRFLSTRTQIKWFYTGYRVSWVEFLRLR